MSQWKCLCQQIIQIQSIPLSNCVPVSSEDKMVTVAMNQLYTAQVKQKVKILEFVRLKICTSCLKMLEIFCNHNSKWVNRLNILGLFLALALFRPKRCKCFSKEMVTSFGSFTTTKAACSASIQVWKVKYSTLEKDHKCEQWGKNEVENPTMESCTVQYASQYPHETFKI